MKPTKRVAEYNLSLFVQQIADLVSQGWVISPTVPANMYGYLYECELEFDGEPPAPPMSRAEVLAKARAAKAEKAKASAEQTEELQQDE